MWFLVRLLRVVFRAPLPHLHRFVLLLSFLPASRILQRQLDEIIGELGHGDSELFGLMVKVSAGKKLVTNLSLKE